MPDKAIVKIVQRYLREVERAGISVVSGVLYGSHARGDARKNSDIDLLVVAVESGRGRLIHDADLLWRLRARVDYRIEPLLVTPGRWRHDDGSPMLATIREEGVVIVPNRPRGNAQTRHRTAAA